MASPEFVDLLCNHVDNLTDYRSFIPIMRVMAFDIQGLQSLIKSKIQTLNAAATRKLAFNAMPIDTLLPMDTIQHILSFNHCKNVKFVCESFKKSFERNQEIIRRSRKKIVTENGHHFSPDVPFDESIGKTYIVRPAGEPLMEMVESLEEDVVVHDNLKRCLSDLGGSSGARIFIQSGCYEIELEGEAVEIENQNLQIIGIGEKVEICFEDRNAGRYDSALDIYGNSKVLFENITFKGGKRFDEETRAVSLIGVWDSIIWMDRCNLRYTGSNVEVYEDACAYFKSCRFESGDPAVIKYSDEDSKDTSRITILDCVFDVNWHGCFSTNDPVICVGSVIYGNSGLFSNQMEKQVINQSLLQGNLNIRDGIASMIDEY